MYIKRATAVGNPKKPSLGDPHAQQIDSVVTATRLFILHFSAQFKKVPLKPLKVKVDWKERSLLLSLSAILELSEPVLPRETLVSLNQVLGQSTPSLRFRVISQLLRLRAVSQFGSEYPQLLSPRVVSQFRRLRVVCPVRKIWIPRRNLVSI